MKTYHRLLEPFRPDNTKAWSARNDIRNALVDLANAADEARLCLRAKDQQRPDAGKLKQATKALRAAEQAIAKLWSGHYFVCESGEDGKKRTAMIGPSVMRRLFKDYQQRKATNAESAPPTEQ